MCCTVFVVIRQEYCKHLKKHFPAHYFKSLNDCAKQVPSCLFIIHCSTEFYRRGGKQENINYESFSKKKNAKMLVQKKKNQIEGRNPHHLLECSVVKPEQFIPGRLRYRAGLVGPGHVYTRVLANESLMLHLKQSSELPDDCNSILIQG